jgi:hypothetical protein
VGRWKGQGQWCAPGEEEELEKGQVLCNVGGGELEGDDAQDRPLGAPAGAEQLPDLRVGCKDGLASRSVGLSHPRGGERDAAGRTPRNRHGPSPKPAAPIASAKPATGPRNSTVWRSVYHVCRRQSHGVRGRSWFVGAPAKLLCSS